MTKQTCRHQASFSSLPVTKIFPFQSVRNTVGDSRPSLGDGGMQRSLGTVRIPVLCPLLRRAHLRRADLTAMTNGTTPCCKALSPTLIFVITTTKKSSDTEVGAGLIFCRPVMTLNPLRNIAQHDCLITVIRERGRNPRSVKEAPRSGNGFSASWVH